MSDEWVESRMRDLGLYTDGTTYDKYISKIDTDGNVVIRELDEGRFLKKVEKE